MKKTLLCINNGNGASQYLTMGETYVDYNEKDGNYFLNGSSIGWTKNRFQEIEIIDAVSENRTVRCIRENTLDNHPKINQVYQVRQSPHPFSNYYDLIDPETNQPFSEKWLKDRFQSEE